MVVPCVYIFTGKTKHIDKVIGLASCIELVTSGFVAIFRTSLLFKALSVNLVTTIYGGGVICGIKIPQQELEPKMQGGLYARRGV